MSKSSKLQLLRSIAQVQEFEEKGRSMFRQQIVDLVTNMERQGLPRNVMIAGIREGLSELERAGGS